MRFFLKILISSALIATASELGKRSSTFAAVLASLPLTSLLVIVWLYLDTGDATKVSSLFLGIFWAVLPSLGFFLILPLLLKQGFGFGTALPISLATLVVGYSAYVWILGRWGITF